MEMGKGIEWMIYIRIEVLRIDWWYAFLILFILCNVVPELCYDWYVSLWWRWYVNDVALSALHYVL